MNFTPANITNLLGVANGPTGNGNPSGNAANAAGAGVLFGDIISGLLLGGANNPAQLPFARQTATQTNTQDPVKQLLGEMTNVKNPQTQLLMSLLSGGTDPQTVSTENSGIVEQLLSTINSSNGGQVTGVQAAQDGKSDAKSAGGNANTANVTPNILSLLPQQAVVLNQNVKNVVNELPIDLPAGKYDVVSSTVSNGQLQLQVVSQDNPSQQIQVNISMDALKDLLTGNNLSNAPAKLDLGVAQNNQSNFANLIGKLNLKSIEVAQQPAVSAQVTPDQSTTISLFGGATGSELMLKAQLPRTEVRAVATDDRSSKKTQTGDPTELVKDITSSKSDQGTDAGNSKQFRLDSGDKANNTSTNVKNNLIAQQQDSTPDSSVKDMIQGIKDKTEEPAAQAKDLLNLAGKDDKSSARVTGDKAEPFVTSHKISIDATTTDVKKPVQQPVKVVLPEDLKSALKPSGREITLKIEPEHLGPAKLSLSLHDDGISARLVVNNTNAKSTLEGSLDKLMTQLEKADIKVQQIQVTVSGEAPQHQMFERRPDWTRNNRFGRNRIKDENTIEENIMQVTHSPAARGGYVGSGRVNLLA